jgi:hypothetical protein
MVTLTGATLYNGIGLEYITPADEIGFAETLMYGIEKQLLLFYIMLYTIIDIASPDLPYLAFFLTIIVGRILLQARVYFGQRNFAAKTLL